MIKLLTKFKVVYSHNKKVINFNKQSIESAGNFIIVLRDNRIKITNKNKNYFIYH